MRKRMVVGIAVLLLVLRVHKAMISTKLAYRSSLDKFKTVIGHDRGELEV